MNMSPNQVVVPTKDFSPHLIVNVSEEKLGKLGYVVIDRPVQGATSGGVRFAPDVSPGELASLARSMTYKWAFLNIPMGGAKAGIFADFEQLGCDRTTLMEAFGRAIAPLVQRNIYHPGVDLGTTLEDLHAIMRGAGRPLVGPQIDGSLGTALTVFEAIRQAASFQGKALAELRVAIEGFGKVARRVAELLAQAGTKIVAISTLVGGISAEAGLDISRLLQLQKQYGDQLVAYYPEACSITQEELFTQKVDLLIPGARPRVIHTDNVKGIQAKLIVPISNAPLTPEVESLLAARQTLVIPDFVSNCGGILASGILSDGFGSEELQQVVEKTFAQIVRGILEEAQRNSCLISEIAQTLAWQNHLAFTPSSTPPRQRLNKVLSIWGGEGTKGIWQRLAWRLHQHDLRFGSTVRGAAADRFINLRLGVTLTRLTSGRSS
jgi:glutamate dehydrogenase (NAD(P)+)